MSRALLVRGGFVYTADAAGTVLPDGAVLSVDGTIAAIGSDRDVSAALREQPADIRAATEELDAAGTMVLPGLVNAHWHSALGNALRAADPHANLWQERPDPWTDALDAPGMMSGDGDAYTVCAIFGRPGLGDTPPPADETRTFAEYGLWLQLRCGITTTADVGSGEQSAALGEVAGQVGIRCATSVPAFDGVCLPDGSFERTRPVDDVVADVRAFLEQPADPDDRVRRLVACGYSLCLSQELGTQLAQLITQHDTVFATHVGCFPSDAVVAEHVFGRTPFLRLADMGLLTDRLLAVHGGFATAAECERMLEAGVHLNYSPAKYALSGESPVTAGTAIRAYLAAGGPVSLSTDGLVLPLGGMIEAMQVAWQLHNQLLGSNVALRPSRVLELATVEGARALRWQGSIGSLEVGKRADLVLVPIDDWRYLLRPRPFDGLLLAGGSNDVDTVVVDGEVTVRHGRGTRFDDTELTRRYVASCRARARRVWGLTAADLGRLADTATPARGR